MWGGRARLTLHRNAAGARAAWLRSVAVVSASTGVPADKIASAQRPGFPARPRNNPVCLARSVAVYLTVVGQDINQAALARGLGVPKTRVWRFCRRIEERRDNAAFDAWISEMEARL